MQGFGLMEICDKNIDEGKFHALCAQLPICLVGYAQAIRLIWQFIRTHFIDLIIYGVIAFGLFLVVVTVKVLWCDVQSVYETVFLQIRAHPLLQCTFVFVMLVTTVWAVSLFRRYVANWRNKESPKVLCQPARGIDAPIVTSAEDLLDRLPFVDSVIAAIKDSCHNQGASFIALYGSWGEGKTSVVNIMEDMVSRFEQNLYLVRFAPWGRRDKEGYAFDLCNTLAETIAGMGFRAGAIDMRLFGAKISKSSIWETLVSQSGFFNVVNSFMRAFSSPEALELRIRDVLGRLPMNQRLVVVIDDVDRLMHKEIIELIRLIRTNCNFPRVTYLVLADQRHVEIALGREIVGDCGDNCISAGHEYLEKIFPTAFQLPRLPKERLPNLLLARIQKSLDNKRLSMLSESSCAAKIMKLLVKTMRHVEQCEDYIDSQLYYLYVNPQNHARPCIYEDDFISLTLVRYFYPDVYETLYEEKDGLLARRMWRKEELAVFFNLGQDKAKTNVVWIFLINILHFKLDYRNASSGKLQAYWTIDYKYNDAMRDYRMVVSLCYDNYFTGYTERFVAISKAQVEEFAKEVAASPHGSRIEELLQKFYNNAYLRPLFYALQGDENILKNNNVSFSNVFISFAKIVSVWFSDKTYNIENPITCLVKDRALYADLIECLRVLVMNSYPEQRERGEFLNRIFEDQNLDYGMLLLLAMLLERESAAHLKPNVSVAHDNSDHLMWDDINYNNLLALFVNKVRTLSIDARPNEPLLREKWLWLSKMCEWNEEIRNTYDEMGGVAMSGSNETGMHWLLPFLTDLADEDKPWVVGIDYSELSGMRCFDEVLRYFMDRGSLLPPAWELIGKYVLCANDKQDSDNWRYTMEMYLHDNKNADDISRIVYRYENYFARKNGNV